MDPADTINPDISYLKSVTISKNGNEFKIFPADDVSVEILDTISFQEKIESINIGGKLIVKDLYNWSGELNLHSFEKVRVEFYIKQNSPVSGGNINLTTKKIDFNVISVSQITKKNSVLLDGDQTQEFIRIDFATESPLVEELEKNIVNFDGDFVGYISTDGDQEIPGLINEIFKKLDIHEYEIEPTYNGIWIRENEISYPWAKSKGQSKLEQLLYYITDHAVSKNNSNAVNFFLWRDSYGYHFKSVDTLLKEQKGSDIQKLYFTEEEAVENNQKIIDIYQMNEANVLALSKNDAFQSYYERYYPNYDDFYLDFVDTSISFKKDVVDYDYHRDFETWESVEKYRLVTNNQDTSNKSLDNKKYIQSLKVDDNIYGYFEAGTQNTPFYQKWDYIGASGDSRWNDIVYIPQFNITELDIKTFRTIHKKIREPLIEKRSKYSHMKNLKRKWEVYRCSVCCLTDRYGGIQDQADILRLQGIDDPNSNPEYIALFGATGLFAETAQEYRIAAAGSFSDVYNYDIGISGNNGITLSYDMNSFPYNQSIREFYGFDGAGGNLDTNIENYEKYIFDHGFKTYDIIISKYRAFINIIDEFLAEVGSYISQGDQYFSSIIEQAPPSEQDKYTTYTDTYVGNAQFRISPVEPDGYEVVGGVEIPDWVFQCSKSKFLNDRFFALGDLTDEERSIINDSFPLYDYYTLFTYGENFEKYFNKADEVVEKLLPLIDQKKAYCRTCLQPITLEIRQRLAIKNKALLEQNIILLEYLKNTLQTSFYEKWKAAKDEYLNRKSFFISKKNEKLDNNIPILSQSSLFNVKSIKRTPIRGSRYEILARNKGVTGAQIGPYLYNIFFDDNSSRNYFDSPYEDDSFHDGDHPYYNQKYKVNFSIGSFLYEKTPTRYKNIEDHFTSNDPPFLSQYSPNPDNYYYNSKLPYYFAVPDIDQNETFIDNFYADPNLRNIEFKFPNEISSTEYENRYNLFTENLTFRKPPNIKREEISSYVRIEFKTPIGLESIVDFPDGFVRTAGNEYFLPYLVSLTSGPNGRQTINQNLVVIGMDPYGFDVAMKRIKDPLPNGEYYWWSSGINEGQMDLWPEVAFETEYTYYSDSNLNNNLINPSYNSDNNYYINFTTTNRAYDIERYKPIPNVTITDRPYGSGDESGYNANLSNLDYSSGYLKTVNKCLKVSRNWWSFHVPSNIIIVPYFSTLDYSINDTLYTDASILTTDLISLQQNGKPFQNRNNSFYTFYENLASFEIYQEQNFINLDYTQSEASKVIKSLEFAGFQYQFPIDSFEYKLSPYKEELFSLANPEIRSYFYDITNWWLSGTHIIYRPGLVTEDIWKYDLSGYTEYGITTPPTTKNHPDIFDHNFAGQFIVFSRQTASISTCERSGLKCINPGGTNTTAGCPADDPYCNCPAQNRQPTEPEPSYLDLYKMEQEIKECSLIEEHLGEEWLGCVWSNPDNTASCNCPEIGDKFMDYLEYSRTYSTFWSTPKKTPLLRKAQKELLFSQTISIVIEKNDEIKVGSLVSIQDTLRYESENIYNRYYGNWLVTSILNLFSPSKTTLMFITLNRDSLPMDPNKSKTPVKIIKM
jgi:hypothetical protein